MARSTTSSACVTTENTTAVTKDKMIRRGNSRFAHHFPNRYFDRSLTGYYVESCKDTWARRIGDILRLNYGPSLVRNLDCRFGSSHLTG